MNTTVLEKMERIIRTRIAAKKEVGEKYDFQEIKRQVLFENRGDIGNEREAYSSELSSRFAKKSAKSNNLSDKKRKAPLPDLESIDYGNHEFKRHLEALS